MSKLNCQTTQITEKALKALGPYEFKVFMAWFMDKEGYDATQQQLSAKTGINVDSVSKIMKKLVEKKFLTLTGKKYVSTINNSVNTYCLGPEFLATKEVEINVPVKIKTKTKPEPTIDELLAMLDEEDDFDKEMDLKMGELHV